MPVELTVVLRFGDAVDAGSFLDDVEDDFECSVIASDMEDV